MSRRQDQVKLWPFGQGAPARGFEWSRGRQRGFTLIEMLVSLAITAIISVMLMQSLVKTSKKTHDEFQVRTMQNSARLALVRVSRELEAIGLNTYASPTLRQPKLIYAGPNQIAFNADVDVDLDPNDAINPRLGPIKDDASDFTEMGDPSGMIVYDPNSAYTRSDCPDLTRRRGDHPHRVGRRQFQRKGRAVHDAWRERLGERLLGTARFASLRDTQPDRPRVGARIPGLQQPGRQQHAKMGNPCTWHPPVAAERGFVGQLWLSKRSRLHPHATVRAAASLRTWGYFCQQDDGRSAAEGVFVPRRQRGRRDRLFRIDRLGHRRCGRRTVERGHSTGSQHGRHANPGLWRRPQRGRRPESEHG